MAEIVEVMKVITPAQSLFRFNLRVLELGKVHKSDSIEKMRRALFFNKVFLSNMDELFYKMNGSEIAKEYEIALEDLDRNLSLIENSVKWCRLTTGSGILGMVGIINKRLPIKDLDKVEWENGIWWISKLNKEEIMLSYINHDSTLYRNGIKINNTWASTDDVIVEGLKIENKCQDVSACRIKLDKDLKICKIEYRDKWVKEILESAITGKDVNWVRNKWLWIEDLERALGKEEVIETEKKHLDLRFNNILKEDRIGMYPYCDFNDYLAFLRNAVSDKNTKKIMLTLYRIGKNSEIGEILKSGVSNGIEIWVAIEMCASNEDINVNWAEDLQRAGINVKIYKYQEMKVHSKLTLVKKVNGDTVCQIGTGNYHYQTAKQYSDLTLYTGDKEICKNVERCLGDICTERKVFEPDRYTRDLLVTQCNFRSEFDKLLDREILKGPKGYICMKCNSFDDEWISGKLDEAGRNKCQVDLIVRGICTWIPLYENQFVRSIVGEVLEHSRIYCFGRVDPVVYIGSLDLVEKKIENRIETLVRIKDKAVKAFICKYMNSQIFNKQDSWMMNQDGKYLKL